MSLRISLRERVQAQSELEEMTIASFNEIVSEYNAAIRLAGRRDAEQSIWLPFKEAGFLSCVEDLNTVTTSGMMVGTL